MAITISQVAEALEGADLKYFKADETTILTAFGTREKTLNIVIRLGEDGEYLDLHTVGFATCPAENPNLAAVHAELLKQNLTYKLLKFSWDPSDGEVRATTSLPIEDNTKLAGDQVEALIAALVAGCKEARPEIEKLIDQRQAPSMRESGGRAVEVPKPKAPAETHTVPVRTPTPAPVEPAKSAVPTALSIGVFMLGLAAVLGVVYLFMHKG